MRGIGIGYGRLLRVPYIFAPACCWSTSPLSAGSIPMRATGTKGCGSS